jgi:ATP-binding cassette subfamily B protein
MLRLFKFLRPYRWMITAILLLVFGQTLADLYLPTLMGEMVNFGIITGNIAFIWQTGGLMLLISAVGVLCAVLGNYFAAKVAVGLGRIVRQAIFTRVESFSLHEFDQLGTSTLITRTTNDVTQVQNVTVMIMRMLVAAPMMMVGGVIMALSKDGPLTLVFVVALPVLAGTLYLIASRALPLFKVMQEKIDGINLVLRENLTGMRVIRAFNRTRREQARFAVANADLTDNYIRVNRIMAFMMPAVMLIMNLATTAILWFGIIRIDSGGMSVGALVAFSQYAFQILFSVIMVTMMFIMLPRAAAAAARINEVLDTVPEINDPAQPVKVMGGPGRVEFRDVTFSYPGAEQPALTGISFVAQPGEMTAIIGGTGAGKSSLVNLIPRFYDVNSGSVLVDGVDVRAMTQADLRRKIGLVPQKSVLFSGSVLENIRYGDKKATSEEALQAAEIAQAAAFIHQLPEGLGGEVAQGGANLSGGQKQRLAIARALVRRPPIYIFDDSFAALDYHTEARLRAALRQELAASTIFLVSQRVATVMEAQRIIVLDEGKIVGMGSHRELLEGCQIYREIVFSQLTREEIA